MVEEAIPHVTVAISEVPLPHAVPAVPQSQAVDVPKVVETVFPNAQLGGSARH
jgi:hypothetical protein